VSERQATQAGASVPVFEWIVTRGLASLMTLGAIAWALDLPVELNLDVYPAQFFAAILALALPLVFVTRSIDRKPQTRVPWYDWLAAAVGFGAVGYLTWNYQQIVDLILLRPTDVVIAGSIALALSLEGLRRSTGNTLPIIAILFIIYALFGDVFSGRLAARPTDYEKLVGYLALDVNGVLGLPLAVAATIVITFLLFGQLLNVSGGSRFFTDIATLTMGKFRGGPAKIAVVASALFGSISGSAVANVAATGVITIPMIKKSGYAPHRAAAIEAVASTGGQLMPPVMGASAFLMAEFLQIPYAQVVLAALIPSILYYISLFIQADLEAARIGATGLQQSEMPSSKGVLSGLYFIIPFAVLITALFAYNKPPQLAALYAAAVLAVLALVFGYKGERPSWRVLLASIYRAALVTLDIIMVCVAAGIVIGVLGISGLGFNLTFVLVSIGEGSLITLLMLAAGVCIVLGMGLPTVGVYVLLAALVAPALIEVGVTPIAAHLYVMYFGMMSMITPPVAIAAFAAAGIAGAAPMRTGWAALRFGWMAYVVPILFVMSPSLLLIGEPGPVVLALVSAVIGVWLVSIAVAGYLIRPLTPVPRLAFGAAGLMALMPAQAFTWTRYIDLIGIGLGAGLLAFEYYLHRGRGAATRSVARSEE
jgi:TRAP transporter 4TM/12TM fusion protein